MALGPLERGLTEHVQLVEMLPQFEATLAATKAYNTNGGPTFLEVQKLRVNTQAYTDLPFLHFALRLGSDDRMYSFDEMSGGVLRRYPNPGKAVTIAGYRLDFSLTPPFTDEILFSAAWIEHLEGGRQLNRTYSPHIYIGIGFSALSQRVRVRRHDKGRPKVHNPYKLLNQT